MSSSPSTLLGALVGVSLALVAAPAHAIIGGANDASDPAVVAVSMTLFGAYCSGALVAPRLVLTAGHCLDEDPKSVVLGGDESSGKSVAVASSTAHPMYTKEGADFDLAVLVLEHDVEGVVPLATNHVMLDDAIVGKDVRHVGFGTTKEGNIFDIGTKHTVVYPVTKLDPTRVYSGSDTKNTCDGDSGGPALFAGADGVERIIAVVSDGPNCHGEGWDIRLDVPDVSAWLDPLIVQYGGVLPLTAPDGGSSADAGAAEAGGTPPSSRPSPSGAQEDAGRVDVAPPAGSGCAIGSVGVVPPIGTVVALALALGARRRSSRVPRRCPRG